MEVASVAGLALQSGSDEGRVRFVRFVEHFLRRFKDPAMLDGVDCRESHREYVFRYFAKTFTHPSALAPRHLHWFRRLEPLLSLPRGARVLDYGGGYGMDSVFLASCGYDVTLFEISPHHLAIARRLAEDLSSMAGPLSMHFVQSTPATDAPPDVPPQDAVLLDEVAHHIEPPEKLFARCARILRPGGRLFLLEPSFWSPKVQAFFLHVRGFRTTIPMVDEITGAPYLYGNEHIRSRRRWESLAGEAGFALEETSFIGDFGRRVERIPLLRDVLCSHLTMRFSRAKSAFPVEPEPR